MTAAYTYLIDTGTVGIDTTDLLTDVEGEWISSFGSSLSLDASTNQGVMIASETTSRTGVMKNNSDVANTINPDLSYGVFLDAICALLGVERGTNQSTVLEGVNITGNAPTSINAGSRVQTQNGDIFYLVNQVTIPAGGSIPATFQSQAFGAIAVPQQTLDIVDGTVGWGSAVVTINTTIVPGTTQLTDPQLKNARNQQLAKQGTASTAAMQAAVLDVPNVTSCKVIENNTGAAGAVNGVTFTLPNAIWVCVAGNNPAVSGVASALYGARNPGVPWDYGAAGDGIPVNSPGGVAVIDPSNGITSYVKWTTPILYDCYVHITVLQNQNASPGATAIQQAIMDYANGLQAGEAGFVVSANVSAYEISGGVAREYPGVYIKECSVACVPQGNTAPPAWPNAAYIPEFLVGQFGQANLQIGNITVLLE